MIKNFLLISLTLTILILIFYSFYSKENYSNYRFNFENKDLNNLLSDPPEFEVISLDNPSGNDSVLKQKIFTEIPYKIYLNVDTKYSYSIIYWKGTDVKYDGKGIDVNLSNEDEEIIDMTIEIDSITYLDNIKWQKIKIMFDPNTDIVYLNIGNTGRFNQGIRYYSDIQVKKNLHQISDYEFTDQLKFFSIFNISNDNASSFKDNTQNYQIEFTDIIKNQTNGINLDKNLGEIHGDSSLLNLNERTIFIMYTAKEMEKGSIFYISGNDKNYAINIILHTEKEVNNVLKINYLQHTYIYKIGLIDTPIIFTIVHNSKDINLYINSKITSANRILDLDLQTDDGIFINKDKNLSGTLHSLIIYENVQNQEIINKVYQYLMMKIVLNLSSFRNIDTCDSNLQNNIKLDIQEKKEVKNFNNCPFLDDKICRNEHCQCVDWMGYSNLTNINSECKKIVNNYCSDNYNDPQCNKLRQRKCNITHINSIKNQVKKPASCQIKIIQKVIDPLKIKQERINSSENVFSKNSQEIETQNNEINSKVVKKGNDNVDNYSSVIKTDTCDKNKSDLSKCTKCKDTIDLSNYILKSRIPCWGCNLDNYDSEGIKYDKNVNKKPSLCVSHDDKFNNEKSKNCPVCRENVNMDKYIRKDKIPCYGCQLE